MGLFGPDIEERPLAEIGTWMLEGKEPRVPEVLRGVFFMDGNPLPEDCGTFQGLEWDAEKRRVVVPMMGHLQWTYEAGRGRRLLFSARVLRNRLEIRFSDDTLTRGTVTPIFFGLLRWPWWLSEHTIERAEGDTSGDTWLRSNSRNFRTSEFGGYTLRRVVREDGSPTAAFQPMLDALPETCMVVVHDGS